MTMFDRITAEQRALIEASKLFFVASAAPDLATGPSGQGAVNLSPKGGTPIHVIDEKRVAYLDYQGSGNETARHATAGGPVTIMVMSMDGEDAGIVRLYGSATVAPLEESPLAARVAGETAAELKLSERQIVDVRVEQTQTSCGYGVPVYEFVADRTTSNRGRRYKDS